MRRGAPATPPTRIGRVVPTSFHPDLDLSPGSNPLSPLDGRDERAGTVLRTTLWGVSLEEAVITGAPTGTSSGYLLAQVGESDAGCTWAVGVSDEPVALLAYAFLPRSVLAAERGTRVALRWRRGGGAVADAARTSGPAGGRADFIQIAMALASQADADDAPARRRVAFASLRTLMLCAGDDVLASFLAQSDVPHSEACPRVFAAAAAASPATAVRVLDQLSIQPISGIVHDAGGDIGDRSLIHTLIEGWDCRHSGQTGRPTIVETLAFLDASYSRRQTIGWWSILRDFARATPWTFSITVARLWALLSSRRFVDASLSPHGPEAADVLDAARITLQRPRGSRDPGRRTAEDLAAGALATDLSGWAYLLHELQTADDLGAAVDHQVVPWMHTLAFPQGRTHPGDDLIRALAHVLVASSVPMLVMGSQSAARFERAASWLQRIDEPFAALRSVGARAAGRLAGISGVGRRSFDARPSTRAFFGGLSDSLQDVPMRSADHNLWREAHLALWVDPAQDRWTELRAEGLRLTGAHAAAGCETCREDLVRLACSLDGMSAAARPTRAAVPLLRALLGWPNGRDAARSLLVWGRVREAWRLWIGDYARSRIEGGDVEQAGHREDVGRVDLVLAALSTVGRLPGKSARGGSPAPTLTPAALAAALGAGSELDACEAIIVSDRTAEGERDAAWRVLEVGAAERLDALSRGSWWALPSGARERVARHRLRRHDGAWWEPWIAEIASAPEPDPVEVDRAVATLLANATMLFEADAADSPGELGALINRASLGLMRAVARLIAENRGDHPKLLRDITEIRYALCDRGAPALGPPLSSDHADLIRDALAIRIRGFGGIPEAEQRGWDGVVGAVARLCGDAALAGLQLGPAWPGLAARAEAALANSLRGVASRLARSLQVTASALDNVVGNAATEPLLASAANAAELAESTPAVRWAASHIAGGSSARDFLLQAIREVGHMLAARNRGVLDADGAARLLRAAGSMLRSLSTFGEEGDQLFPVRVAQVAAAAGCPDLGEAVEDGAECLSSLPAGALFFMLAEITRNAAKHGGVLSIQLEQVGGTRMVIVESGVGPDRAARIRARLARTADTMLARGDGGQGLAMLRGFLRTAQLPSLPDQVFRHDPVTSAGLWTIPLSPPPSIDKVVT